jgi:hypothetical protein
MQLARHNRVQLVWVPGHEGIVGNETADQLARTESEHLFTEPEPACSISIGVAKKAAMDWMNTNHRKYWESTTGLKQAKGLTPRPSARRTKDLLKLNRDQLIRVVALFTGHLFKQGLTDNPICERCLEEEESAINILCDCDAIAYLRFCHLDQFFMEPSDCYDTPINNVLHSIRGVGLIKIIEGRGARAGSHAPPPPTHTHTHACMHTHTHIPSPSLEK